MGGQTAGFAVSEIPRRISALRIEVSAELDLQHLPVRGPYHGPGEPIVRLRRRFIELLAALGPKVDAQSDAIGKDFQVLGAVPARDE